MAQTWPATLPTEFLASGYSESPPDNLIRTKMDIGPDKVRRRTTANVRPVKGRMEMTTAQTVTLDTFYVNTLASGSLTFNFDHPRTGTTGEWRFASQPVYTPHEVGGDWWYVDLDWELLPS